ncbi:MAG: hypothetical protein HRT47_04020 [Candidatus Caenarcaniphilales bacterium]|nr:hypothetical protein [Candidatus Caenarcaniphilales bacterium]
MTVTKKIIIYCFLVLSFTFSFLNIAKKISSPLIQGDEIYEFLRANNKTVKNVKYLNQFNKYGLNTMYDTLDFLTPNKDTFINKTNFYIKHWYELSNHGPGYAILSKIPITNMFESIEKLRYFSLFWILASLIILVLILKKIHFNTLDSVASSILFISFSQVQSIASYSKVYSFLIFV